MLVLNLIRRKKYGLKGWQALVFTILLAAVGMTGVRLLAILEHFDALLQGQIAGGMSFFGSVLLVPILMPLFGRIFGLRIGQTMDLCAPCVAGIVGVMRIACYLVGCCGAACLVIHGEEVYPPVQLMECAWDLMLMCLLMIPGLPFMREGRGYPLFLVGYGFARFLLEFLRDTEKDWFGLSHGQVFSLLAIAAAIIWYILRDRKRSASPAEI